MWLTNTGRTLCGIMRKHPLFIGRTLMVEENDVGTAMTRMNKLLSQDGVIQQIRCDILYLLVDLDEWLSEWSLDCWANDWLIGYLLQLLNSAIRIINSSGGADSTRSHSKSVSDCVTSIAKNFTTKTWDWGFNFSWERIERILGSAIERRLLTR